jgi:hypothetical protein
MDWRVSRLARLLAKRELATLSGRLANGSVRGLDSCLGVGSGLGMRGCR